MSEYIIAVDNEAMEMDGVPDAEHGWDELFQIQRVVPENIPVQSAGLLCTWREVYAGFSDFQLKQGDDIVVFGAGPVGLSFVKFAKLRGLGTVWSIDPVAQKRKKASKWEQMMRPIISICWCTSGPYESGKPKHRNRCANGSAGESSITESSCPLSSGSRI